MEHHQLVFILLQAFRPRVISIFEQQLVKCWRKCRDNTHARRRLNCPPVTFVIHWCDWMIRPFPFDKRVAWLLLVNVSDICITENCQRDVTVLDHGLRYLAKFNNGSGKLPDFFVFRCCCCCLSNYSRFAAQQQFVSPVREKKTKWLKRNIYACSFPLIGELGNFLSMARLFESRLT